MTNKIIVEVIGVEPPCPRCKKTLEVVKEAVRELGIEDKVKIVKLDVGSPEVIERYGIVMSPSVAINGVIRISYRVPTKEKIKHILKEVV